MFLHKEEQKHRRDSRKQGAGAGGAGCAVAHAVAEQAPGALGLFDIDPQRSQDLARNISKLSTIPIFEALPNAKGFDVIINCTSVGMHPNDPLPVDIKDIAPGTLVADIILKPVQTPLLAGASARGCATHQGPNMLEGQVDAITRFFFN
jgi:shikimate dehydrogenase